MIRVSRLDGSMLVINADLIEYIEAIPETIVCLTTGKKVMVRETVDDIINRVAQFKRMTGIRVNPPDTADSGQRSEYDG